MKKVIPLFILFALFFSLGVNAQDLLTNNDTSVAVCNEQLKICVDQYNSLYYDLRNGTNCDSELFNQLKKKNLQVSQDRDVYQEELDNIKVYKPAFYTVSALLVIWIILFVVISLKNKPGRINNGRKTSS